MLKELEDLVFDQYGRIPLLFILSGKSKHYFTSFTLGILEKRTVMVPKPASTELEEKPVW
jgi:hypothetical protein